MLQDGYYNAKAVEAELGFTNGGKEQVAVLFEIVDGEHKGQRITWHGYFTEKTTDRTLESLMHCGWDGEDASKLEGVTKNVVSIVVEQEEYDGKMRAKVQWVNKTAGLALKERMNSGQKASFAEKMRGRAAALKAKTEADGADDFDYGANRNGGPPV